MVPAHPGDAEPIEMAITSDLERIPEVRKAGEGLAVALGFDEEEAKMVALTIDEALANVIRHGYDNKPGQPIQVFMSEIRDANGRGIQIVMKDRARKVDPSQIRGRCLDDIRPGGLGVHLMRTVMDEVTHTPAAQGMILTMTKYLKRPAESH